MHILMNALLKCSRFSVILHINGCISILVLMWNKQSIYILFKLLCEYKPQSVNRMKMFYKDFN